MIQKTYTPHPALREFISHFIYYQVDFDAVGAPSNIYPFYPTHPRFFILYIEGNLRVHHKDHTQSSYDGKCIAIGPQLIPVTLEFSKKHTSIAVGFEPGGMHRLLGMPMHEMIDQHYQTQQLLGKSVDYLMEQLQEAGNIDLRIKLVEAFFLSKLHRLKAISSIDRACIELIRSSGNLSIDWIASQSCLSVRQLERVCKERIGFSPKLYARLIRFSKAYRIKEIHPTCTWTDIGHRCGYYDQMHLIRDFKYFANITPSFVKAEVLEASVRFQQKLVE